MIQLKVSENPEMTDIELVFQLSKMAGRSAAAAAAMDDTGGGLNSANSSKQGTLKEESSDESTIVSSSQVQFTRPQRWAKRLDPRLRESRFLAPSGCGR